MSRISNRPFMIMFFLLALVLTVSPVYAGLPPATGQGTPQPLLPSPLPDSGADTQLKNFDCSKVTDLGIDKQLNIRAGLIRLQCGLDTAGGIQQNTGNTGELVGVTNIGGTDVQVNNALADTYPHVTQNTSSFAAHGSIVVAGFNSSSDAPANYSGVSYSLDGGISFTEIRPSPFATGHGTNYGDPMMIYSNHAGRFYSFWLATGCGSQGVGSWSSFDGINWSIAGCTHIGSADDRLEAWVDNNPASPFYGRIYASFNDFNVGGGALVLVYSTDDGLTWSAENTINPAFIRNVQGVSGPDGKIYLATMNEGGGGMNPRQNFIYYSQDGGLTYNGISMGSPFLAPGDINCTGYFVGISPIWRYMGWGSLGITSAGTLIYAYTAGDVGDIGNIYYVRSLDSGMTWSSPVRLNTDGGTRAQWMPAVGITPNGLIVVSWYDRRNTTNDNYQRYTRESMDGGVTWNTDQPLSDQVIPQPAQPDPNMTSCLAGDYNRTAVTGGTVIDSWTDGRVSINSTAQQDIYADQVSALLPPGCVFGESAWQLDAGLPVDVYGPAVASDGTYVYSAGGYNFSSGSVNTFARYSLITNQWTTLAPLPVAVDDAFGAYLDGKIYVFGGLNNLTGQDATQIYNIATGIWYSGPSMPEPRLQMGGGVYRGKIYLVGGYSTSNVDPGSIKNQTWAFDPATASFTNETPLPSPLGGPASSIINGKLYIAGGRDLSNLALNTLYAYNITSNNWSILSPLPTAVNVAAGAAYSGKLWVMGGGTPFLGQSSVPDDNIQSNAPEAMSTVQIYDPISDTWSAGPSQLAKRSFQGAGVAGGVIVSVGGYNDFGSTAITESFLRQRLNTLIVYSDPYFPAALQSQLLSLPGVGKVDLFDAFASTPSLSQLQQYDLVGTFSNFPYNDAVAMGNVLADYVDNGGIVVDLAFNFLNGFQLGGRWSTNGYSAFNLGSTNFSYAGLGFLNLPGSPLLAGVYNLSVFYRLNTTPVAGAVSVASWSDGTPFLAMKGHVVSASGYFGNATPVWSGNIGQIISNAGFSMRTPDSACYTPHVYLSIVKR